MNRFIRAGLCASACVLTLSGSMAFAQEEPPNSPAEQILEVIQLKHGNAQEIGSTLQRVLRDTRITADTHSNSLIVLGSKESLAAAKSLLAAIDVEVSGETAARANQNQVRAFPLEHATADQRLLSTLSMLLRSTDRDQRSLQLALDSRQNQIIASGQATYLHALDSLLKMMDQPASTDSQASGELSVRLLWLVGGDSGATRDVPADLAPVVKELGNYGVTGLKLGAQSIIRVSTDEEFSSIFTSTLATRWEFQISGRVKSSADAGNRLDIRVQAQGEGQPFGDGQYQQGHAHHFETTIMTESGHFVVLSMNPIGDMDSVFVLQVNEAN